MRETNYAELRSGQVTINGREVPVSPLSSFRISRKIANVLKEWIVGGQFALTEPVESLPRNIQFRPMKTEALVPFVEDVGTGKVVTAPPAMSIEEAARRLTLEEVNSLLIQDEQGSLVGILTSWDIAKAVATGASLVGDVMTRKVIVAHKGEPIDLAARKLEKHGISALPIVDGKRRILGMVSDEDIARFVGRRRW